MDESLGAGVTSAEVSTDSTKLEEASAEFVGRWNRLVSTTNWQKGRIILQWRAELTEADAPGQAYSDEAWSRRVGNVSGQHVGRLRRVCERFGDEYEQYPGLYWSHFHAALDWHDAEMWLEGAVQNAWSVAQMRAQRWDAIGAPPDQKPKDQDIILAEWDEDVARRDDPDAQGDTLEPSVAVVQDPGRQEPDKSRRPDPKEAAEAAAAEPSAPLAETTTPSQAVRPFENLPPLPDDLADALEAFKLAILNHKLAGWLEISPDDVLLALDGLKQLILSPAGHQSTGD